MTDGNEITIDEIAEKIDSLDRFQKRAFLILIKISMIDETLLKLPQTDIDRIYATIRDELRQELAVNP